MQAADLEYTYRYRRESALLPGRETPRLNLITTSSPVADIRYVRGAVVNPKRTADMLIAVVDVVQSRFHIPPAMLAKILRQSDPVVTCSRELCRFEGFSACCGAYVRLDLLDTALDGERFDTGTTNVNFNAPMRAALSRVRDGDPMEIEIGSGSVAVETDEGQVVERKVTLPSRWLRGFTDVQAVQARMRLCFELSGPEFRRFLRELPRGIKGAAWLTFANGSVRISARYSPGAVSVGGIDRLRVLDTVARHAERVEVYGPPSHEDADAGESAWIIDTADSRLTLALSPEVWRGFSGEGQVLDVLARPDDERATAAVKASLRWQERIDVDEIRAAHSLEVEAVERALAQFAATGLVGYDLHSGTYFHRELPFNPDSIPKLQPRLEGARRLVDGAAVEFESSVDPVTAWVRSGDIEYRVVLGEEGDRCTCVWYARHGGARGPCKHILAVRLARDAGDAHVN